MKNILLVCIFLLTACVSQHKVPEQHLGSEALINETYEKLDKNSANVFGIEEINNKPVTNLYNQAIAQRYNYGSNTLTVYGYIHKVEAEPIKLKLTARAAHLFGFQDLTDNTSDFTGEIEFTPLKNQKYMVKGVLHKDYAAIWIEQLDGTRVTKLLERFGPNKEHAENIKKQRLSPHSSALNRFADLPQGLNDDYIIELYGKPSKTTHNKANHFTRRPASTNFIYDDLGIISFYAGYSYRVVANTSTEKANAKNLNFSPTNMGFEEYKLGLSNPDQTIQLQTCKAVFNEKVGLTDEVIFDPVESFLLEHHKQARKDSNLADHLAWLTKCLASSGNSKYIPTLTKLSNKPEHRQLRKHAESSIETLEKFSKWNDIIIPKNLPEDAFPTRVERFANMIQGPDVNLSTWASKKAFKLQLRDPFLIDKALSMVEDEGIAPESNRTLTKKIAWAARYAASSQNTEALNRLQSIIDKTANKKLRNYIEGYIKTYYS